MILRAVIAAFLIFVSMVSPAQRADWLIDPYHVDTIFLWSSVAAKIDNIRTRHKLSPFFTDSILQCAARDHAQYLVRKNKPGPLQTENRHKLTPEKRVIFYGGNSRDLREAEVSVTIHLPELDFPMAGYYHLNTTYLQTADEIAKKLVSHRAFSKYLFKSEYTYSGLAISYNIENKLLHVVLVIGKEGTIGGGQYKVLPSGNTVSVTLPERRNRYDYSLKPPRYDASQRLVNRLTRKAGENIHRSGTVNISFRLGKKVFRWWHLRTGFVYETRDLHSYESEENFHRLQSRFNQRSILNTEVSNFVGARLIRKTARDNYRKMFGTKKITIFGLATPFNKPPTVFLFNAGFYAPDSTARVLLIRKARPCAIFVAQPLEARFIGVPFPILPYSSLPGEAFEKYRVIHERDTVHAVVNYKRGEIIPDDDQLERLIREIPMDRKVVHISMKAFASIEGNEDLNKRLFTERAQKLRDILLQEGLLMDNASVNVTTAENWELFDLQLEGSKLENLREESRENLRRYVNEHAGDSLIDAWLYEQRYGQVTMAVQDPDTIAITSDTMAAMFNEQIYKILSALKGKRKITAQELIRLERLQLGFYSRITDEGASGRWKDLTLIRHNRQFLALEFNEVIYKLSNGLLREDDLFNWLQLKGFEKGLSRSLLLKFRNNSKVYVANSHFLSNNLIDRDNYFFASYRNYILNFIKPGRRLMRDRPNRENLDFLLVEAIFPSLLKEYATQKNWALYRQVRLFHLITHLQSTWPKGMLTRDTKIAGLLDELWKDYVKDEKLSDERRIEWALFFNCYERLNWSVALLTPLVDRANPDHYALSLLLSIKACLSQNRDLNEQVLQASEILTDDEWCNLLASGRFLPISFMENYEIRRLYQEKMARIRAHRE